MKRSIVLALGLLLVTSPAWARAHALSATTPPSCASSAEITVTSAQLKTLAESPVHLIPAQPGLIIVVCHYSVSMPFGTIEYAGGDNLQIQYNAAGGGSTISGGNLAYTLTRNPYSVFVQGFGGTAYGADENLIVNQPVDLSVDNDYADGDGDLNIKIYYDTMTP